uniref:SWIM-type domain-containing protein n=1 Tax=Bursaphelenchus xylophilus TaxID=6326 RepID=A0A1I7S881_BURXY
MLHNALNVSQFRNGAYINMPLIVVGLLMSQSWLDSGIDPNFVEYFKTEWLYSEVFRWFEGASPFPSTNNGVESQNNQIKSQHSFRERLNFHEFVTWATDMIKLDWSKHHPDPSQIEQKTPPHIYASAFAMKRNNRPVFIIQNNEIYAMPSSEHLALDARTVKQIYRKITGDIFESFADYAENRFKVFIVSKSGMRFTCTCPEGTKKNRCKHAVFIECKLNLAQYPPDAMANQLQPKKKRGRPRKAITQSQASRSRVQLQSQLSASSPRRLQHDAPSTSTGFGFSVFSVEPS